LLVLLLAGLFAMVVVTDPVACADGCADNAPHGANPGQPSACAVCHGLDRPAAVVTSTLVLNPVTILPAGDAFARDAHPPAIDHPPRPACPGVQLS
jgi:mono/diheme cytochrome c family protein